MYIFIFLYNNCIFVCIAHPFEVNQLHILKRRNYSIIEQMEWFDESLASSVKKSGESLYAPMNTKFDKTLFEGLEDTSATPVATAATLPLANKILKRGKRDLQSLLPKATYTGRKFGDEHLKGPNIGPLLPQKCYKRNWWEVKTNGFAPQLLLHVAPLIEADSGVKRDYSKITVSNGNTREEVSNVMEKILKKSGLASQVLTNTAMAYIQKKESYAELTAFTLQRSKEFHHQNKRCVPSDEKDILEQLTSKLAEQQHNIQNQMNQKKLNSNSPPITIDMGEVLGGFSIAVHNEGFMVTSAKYGNTLEISNVGQSVVFVKDTVASNNSFSDVMGDSGGNVISCTVKLMNRDVIIENFIKKWKAAEAAAENVDTKDDVLNLIELLGTTSASNVNNLKDEMNRMIELLKVETMDK